MPLWHLNVIEDDYQFLSVHMRLSTRCKIWFTLGLFANYFSLKSGRLSLKSDINSEMCSKVNWIVEFVAPILACTALECTFKFAFSLFLGSTVCLISLFFFFAKFQFALLSFSILPNRVFFPYLTQINFLGNCFAFLWLHSLACCSFRPPAPSHGKSVS